MREGAQPPARRSVPQYAQLVQQEYGAQTLFAPRHLFGIRRLVLLLVLVAVIGVGLFFAANAIGSCAAGGVRPAEWGIQVGEDPSYDLNPTALASVSASSGITPVGLGSQDESFSVEESQLADVQEAVRKIEKTSHCGFVFLDLSNGRMLTYNPAEVMYCASAVKAPLAYYAMTHSASASPGSSSGGGGEDDEEDEDYEDEDEDTSADSGSGSGDSDERTVIENVIQWSSNDDYFTLCDAYFNANYLQWLKTYGVDYNEEEDGNFPSMGARSLAGIWAEIYGYIEGTSTDQLWLSNLFGKTETSYIRDALKGSGAQVRDKAGWISDGETDAVTDAGIITKDDRDYLMVIVTGQRDTDKGHKNVTELARALFEARGLLAPDFALTC